MSSVLLSALTDTVRSDKLEIDINVAAGQRGGNRPLQVGHGDVVIGQSAHLYATHLRKFVLLSQGQKGC